MGLPSGRLVVFTLPVEDIDIALLVLEASMSIATVEEDIAIDISILSCLFGPLATVLLRLLLSKLTVK